MANHAVMHHADVQEPRPRLSGEAAGTHSQLQRPVHTDRSPGQGPAEPVASASTEAPAPANAAAATAAAAVTTATITTPATTSPAPNLAAVVGGVAGVAGPARISSASGHGLPSQPAAHHAGGQDVVQAAHQQLEAPVQQPAPAALHVMQPYLQPAVPADASPQTHQNVTPQVSQQNQGGPASLDASAPAASHVMQPHLAVPANPPHHSGPAAPPVMPQVSQQSQGGPGSLDASALPNSNSKRAGSELPARSRKRIVAPRTHTPETATQPSGVRVGDLVAAVYHQSVEVVRGQERKSNPIYCKAKVTKVAGPKGGKRSVADAPNCVLTIAWLDGGTDQLCGHVANTCHVRGSNLPADGVPVDKGAFDAWPEVIAPNRS